VTDETSEQERVDADAALERRLAEPFLKGDRGIDAAQVWFSVFLIVVLGFAAYSNVFGIPFHVEDQRIIRDNTALHSFLAFPESLSPQSPAPLTMFTFAFNWWIAPGNSAFFHTINLILHLANAILVYLLCRRLLGPSVPEVVAMLAGMFFVVHPLASESVDYIVGRAGLLGMFFMLSALLFFFRATRDPEAASVGALAVSVFLFILAWTADRSALIAPLLILLLDRTQHDSRAMRKRFLIHAPYWAVFVALLAFQAAVGSLSSSATTLAPPGTLPLIKIVAPYGLSAAPSATAAGSTVVLLIAVVIGAALMLFRPIAGFGVLWITLALYVGSICSGGVSERSAYAALPGLAILLPWAFGHIKRPPLRVAAGIAVAMIILAAAYATYLRNSVWQNEIGLWADAVDKAPDSPVPLENLGNAFLAVSSTPESASAAVFAEKYLRKASNMTPGKPAIALNLGLALMYQNKTDEAAEQWLETLRIDPQNRDAALYLALLFNNKANATVQGVATPCRIRAIDYFKRADQLEPLTGAPLGQYAKALIAHGGVEAEPILARIVQGDENSPFAPFLRNVQDLVEQAAAIEEQAAAILKKTPDDPTAFEMLARADVLRGRYLKAAYTIDALLRKNPDSFSSWALLGYVRARMDQTAQFLTEWPQPPPKPIDIDSAWKTLALNCARFGFWESAQTYLESPPAIAENGPPLLVLAEIADTLGDTERARRYRDQAAADSEDPTSLPKETRTIIR